MSNLTFKKTKNLIKLIDSFLESKFLDRDISRAYCLGFVLGVAMFTDIKPENAQDLNEYVNNKSAKEKLKNKYGSKEIVH